MSEEEKRFISQAKHEITLRLNTAKKDIEELLVEKEELIRAINGYSNFYDNLCHSIQENMIEFTQNEEDLPAYFKSNINKVYYERVQIKKDALDEIMTLKDYVEKCRKEKKATERSLKFFKSQYYDSDFFDDCLPLVEAYNKKIELYDELLVETRNVVEQLKNIYQKLEKWV